VLSSVFHSLVKRVDIFTDKKSLSRNKTQIAKEEDIWRQLRFGLCVETAECSKRFYAGGNQLSEYFENVMGLDFIQWHSMKPVKRQE
jgi:hypothetical protein